MKHCLVVLLAAAATAHATPDRSGPASLGADALKSAYLDCERLAAVTFLGGADAANCSLVHEELMERVFHGDFQRLLAWWKAQRLATTPQGKSKLEVRSAAASRPRSD